MNQLHVLPEDWSAAADLITPLLGRIDPGASGPQALIVTNDAESAAGISGRLVARGAQDVRLVAATDARRATRLLSATPTHVVVGPPDVLVQMVRSSALKLGSVQTIVLAWVDDLDAAATGALEAVMTDIPKDSTRLVLAAAPTQGVEQIVERYAWRARRLQPVESDAAPPVSVSYVTAAETARLQALRRLLDAADPESAIVIAGTAESRADVSLLLRSLGYGDTAPVRLAATRDDRAAMAVLFELPSTADELRRLVRDAGATRVVAIVTPRQLDTLRRFAGGTVTPFALPAAAERARSRTEQVREELREVLAAGQHAREVLALEPLLSEYDGLEVAAAALRLLEAERAKPRTAAQAAEPAAMTRLYVNVGEMDGVRPGDLVGAITNQAGISRSELGRVEVRERHSTVEVGSGVANAVVDRMTGVSIKGRRALVKVDEGRDRPTRPARPGGGRDRPGRDRPRRDAR